MHLCALKPEFGPFIPIYQNLDFLQKVNKTLYLCVDFVALQ